MKKCTSKNGCSLTKDIAFYGKDKRNPDGLKSICKECEKKYHASKSEERAKGSKKWRSGNKEAIRDYELKKTYGITLEDYRAMFLEQGGKCLICEETKAHLVVDHNHDTGVVRGLLCNNCNTGIGLLKDNPVHLKNAAEYLITKGFYG